MKNTTRNTFILIISILFIIPTILFCLFILLSGSFCIIIKNIPMEKCSTSYSLIDKLILPNIYVIFISQTFLQFLCIILMGHNGFIFCTHTLIDIPIRNQISVSCLCFPCIPYCLKTCIFQNKSVKLDAQTVRIWFSYAIPTIIFLFEAMWEIGLDEQDYFLASLVCLNALCNVWFAMTFLPMDLSDYSNYLFVSELQFNDPTYFDSDSYTDNEKNEIINNDQYVRKPYNYCLCEYQQTPRFRWIPIVLFLVFLFNVSFLYYDILRFSIKFFYHPIVIVTHIKLLLNTIVISLRLFYSKIYFEKIFNLSEHLTLFHLQYTIAKGEENKSVERSLYNVNSGNEFLPLLTTTEEEEEEEEEKKKEKEKKINYDN